MTPDPLQLLQLLLTALLALIGGLVINALCQARLTKKQKITQLTIGVIDGIAIALLNSLNETHLAEQTFYGYGVLAFSWGFSIIALGQFSYIFSQLTKPERDISRRKQLLEMITVEVKQRLPQPESVEAQPSGRDLQPNLQVNIADQTHQLDRSLAELFPQVDGKLLILGGPGSGKTTELLTLADVLCQNAKTNPEAAIPVIFELSQWQPSSGSLQDWMVEQLQLHYGLELDPKTSQEWLNHNRILPLLDGLNGDRETMAEAILAINELLGDKEQPSQPVVVCCRTQDYQRCQERLHLNTAVCLQPLTHQQIQEYLQNSFDQPGYEKFVQTLKQDQPGLLTLARTPLGLHLMPKAYPDAVVPKLEGESQEVDNPPNRRLGQLFDAYIEQCLGASNESDYQPSETRRYLTWLANTLQREGKTEFLIEGMQPSWLKKSQQRFALKLVSSLLIALIWGLLFGGIYALIEGDINTVMPVVIGILIAAIVIELVNSDDTIKFNNFYNINVSNIKEQKGATIIGSLMFGLIGGGLLGLLLALPLGLIFGLLFGLLFGILCGVVYGVIIGFQSDIKVNRDHTNTLEKSLKTMAFIFLVSSSIWGIGFFINHSLMDLAVGNRVFPEPRESVGWGIISGLLMGLHFGRFEELLKHGILRFMLYRQGAIPWNYAHFLEEASQRGLLKQFGGRFRFYHELLRDHLAGTL